MAPRPAPERPDWLVVGAPVVVDQGDWPIETVVATISTHYFTLSGYADARYRIRTMSRDRPGHGQLYVYSRYDPRAVRVLGRRAKADRRFLATIACERYLRDPTPAHRRALIAAVYTASVDETVNPGEETVEVWVSPADYESTASWTAGDPGGLFKPRLTNIPTSMLPEWDAVADRYNDIEYEIKELWGASTVEAPPRPPLDFENPKETRDV
jgi:hypothetical protein